MGVDWDEDTQTATASGYFKYEDGNHGILEIRLTVNNTTAYVNGIAVELDVPPRIVNGRMLVPLRFIAEAAGRPVEWDASNMRVIIYQGNQPVG